MTGFEFLPITFVACCFAFTQWHQRKSAERQAAGWEKVATDQKALIVKMEDAMKNQGEALQGALDALQRRVA